MLNKWGKNSLALINKKGLNPKLRDFLLFIEEIIPESTITDTFRTAEEQNCIYKKNDGSTNCDGYNKISKHQYGNAFDIVPYPSMWESTSKEWIQLHVAIMIGLHEFNKKNNGNMKIKWGGLWNESQNKIGWDLPHYEIIE